MTCEVPGCGWRVLCLPPGSDPVLCTAHARLLGQFRFWLAGDPERGVLSFDRDRAILACNLWHNV
jgi:hypothetical protein